MTPFVNTVDQNAGNVIRHIKNLKKNMTVENVGINAVRERLYFRGKILLGISQII